ncbi:MAG: hypothetical protein JNG84_06025 [Archangium sp.]|nr:hypothetical protein [Archangium sp.]
MTRSASKIVLLLVPSALALAEPPRPATYEARRGIALSDRLVLDANVLDRLPSTGSTSTLIAYSFLPALSGLEESMGWSDIEPERLSIVGNSALWTEFRLEDFNISDPFFDGAAAFKVPYAFISEMELRTAESAFHRFGGGFRYGVAPVARRPTRSASASFSVGWVGDTFPLAEHVTDYFSAKHPRNRFVPPEEDRRHFTSRVKASALDTFELDRFTLRSAVEVDANERHQLDFPSWDGRQASASFNEPTLRLTGISELAPAGRAWRAFALTEFRQRANLYTERKFTRAETQGQASGGVLVGLLSDAFRAGVTFKHDTFTPSTPAFTRELMDVDGEGFFPFIPGGGMNSLRFDVGYKRGGFYADGDLRMLAWKPGPTQVHPLTYFGNAYGTMTLESRPTVTWVGAQRVGYQRTFTTDSGRAELAIDAYGALNHTHAVGSSGLTLPDVGLEVQGVVHVARWFQPFLAISKTPISIPTQTALALTPGYQSATERLADGRLVRTVGGDFTTSPGVLLPPNIYSASFGITSRIGEKWKVALQGIAKAWHGLSRLVLDGAAEDYGHFTNDVFFFDGRPTRYRLQNDPFSETPYGGMVQLEVSRLADENGFFTFGFSAANFFGWPPFGNGAYGNDIGIVDWAGANPNARLRSVSNTDADRAFITKAAGGYRFWRSLWGSFQVLFKDGQPFAFYDHHVEYGQLAMQLNSHRGSAMKISYPLRGWREDFQVHIDVKLSYDFPLGKGWLLRTSVVAANMFDLGNEVNERQSPSNADYMRSSLELTLPRSLSFGVELLDIPRAPAESVATR